MITASPVPQSLAILYPYVLYLADLGPTRICISFFPSMTPLEETLSSDADYMLKQVIMSVELADEIGQLNAPEITVLRHAGKFGEEFGVIGVTWY